jgi:hypothetical protein
MLYILPRVLGKLLGMVRNWEVPVLSKSFEELLALSLFLGRFSTSSLLVGLSFESGGSG